MRILSPSDVVVLHSVSPDGYDGAGIQRGSPLLKRCHDWGRIQGTLGDGRARPHGCNVMTDAVINIENHVFRVRLAVARGCAGMVATLDTDPPKCTRGSRSRLLAPESRAEP